MKKILYKELNLKHTMIKPLRRFNKIFFGRKKEMKNIKKLLSIMIIALMVSTTIPIQAEAAVKISATKKTMYVGDTITLKVSGTKKKVTWSSNRTTVATVTKKGKVLAKSEGVTTITAKVGQKSLKCKITVKERDYSDKVKILSEYTLPDGIGWYTRHFMVVKNTSDVTVDISTSSIAYASDGAMVAADEASEFAIGAGCTTIIYEAFETSTEISYYKTEIKAKESKYYKSVIQDLSYTKNDIEDGAIFQVKNNGNYAAKFVEGYALFFLNGKLVGYDDAYFTDDESEIKPGATITKQFTSYENFDKVEFYLTGRR